MQFRDDRRGQAIQIGAVLLLGAVVLSLSIYQASVVPEQNREIEFKHSQQVQDQLGDARNAIVSTGSTGDGRSVSVQMGTQYPSRIIAMNPSPPSGRLSTVGTTDGSVNVTVSNATATGETGNFWIGTDRSYNTGAIVYRPGYNEYTSAPTTWYENSVLFDEFRDANLTVTDQRLVDGDRISLVTLNGSYYTSRSGSAALDFRPVSTSTRTVSVTNATATSNVTITVPTRLNASDWEALLAEEMDSGHVASVTTAGVTGEDYRMLRITLDRLDEEGQRMTYDLDIARVGVGTQVVRPDAAYLTDVAGNGSTVPENGETQFTVEIRDALNNPKKDVRVVAGTRWGNSSVSPESATTDSDGQVTLVYDAPEDIDGVTQGTDRVQVSLNTSLSDTVNGTAINGSTAENVSMVVRVDNSDGSGLDSGDTNGPQVKNPQASPNPVDQGEKLDLKAIIDDVGRGTTDIMAAEWFRTAPSETISNQDPGKGNATPMSPVDSQWDQPIEDVESTEIDTTSWAVGEHTISFRGEDYNGNWGPVQNITVTVQVASGDSPPTASIDEVKDQSSTGKGAKYKISWSASDDNELDTVNVQLIDSNGTAVDSQSTAVSGTSAQDKNTQLSDSGGYEDEYTIKIIVTDSAGQEDTDTVTDTAEGTDP